MRNDIVSAAGEAMPAANINRRLFLRNTAAAGAVAATIAAPVVAEAATVSPRERLDAAIAELKAAAEQIWPDIEDWTANTVSDENAPYAGCPLVIAAHKPSLPKYAEWSGPALYELQDGKYRPIYYVERVWAHMDGAYVYRGCHFWKSKKEGPWVYFGRDELKIIRKVRDVPALGGIA